MKEAEFEVKKTDLAGRIARLKTKSGKIETPAVLPVIHPIRQTIPCKEIKEMGFEAVMTNAYLISKRIPEEEQEKGVHKIIDFDGVVMTDSGGYQVLLYGEVDAKPEDIAKFEEKISSDIAVILDTPTGVRGGRRWAEKTVEETLLAAKKTLEVIKRKDILWAGTIQGGKYFDLIEKSAKELSNLGFPIMALGSPTEVMESYNFTLLANMIISAKSSIPVNKPLHLFGAGHPLTIPLAVALGCDLFDSASYILYARDKRYMTLSGTLRLEDMEYLPCICPICSKYSLDEIKERNDSEELLARHNLYILIQTIKEVKQAIHEGRLWELVSERAKAHPLLHKAFKIMANVEYLEDATPLFKQRAIFISTQEDTHRPEVKRARRKIKEVIEEEKKELLVLIADWIERPVFYSNIYTMCRKILSEDYARCCVVSPIYGIYPIEVSDIYPLSQYEVANVFDKEFLREIAKKFSDYKKVLFVTNEEFEEANNILHELFPNLIVVKFDKNNKKFRKEFENACKNLLSVD